MITLLAIAALATPIEGNITHGPIVSAVTDTSVKVWARGDGVRNIVVEYRVAGTTPWTTSSTVNTASGNDYTAQWELDGLTASTDYQFRTNNVAKTLPGNTRTVRTFPTPGEDATFTVAIFADVFSSGVAANATPSWSRALPYHPLQVLQIGDWDHRDAGAGEPWSVPESRWWSMHQAGRDASTTSGAAFRSNIIGPANGTAYPMVYDWDDHDWCWNNSDGNCERGASALLAYREYFPSYEEPSDGIYEHWTIGQAEFFKLDVRSFRSPYTDPDDGSKTMLGATQKAWLEDGLTSSTAVWKVIITPSAWNPTTGKGDSWATYETEAAALRDAVSGVTGVVLVSGDLHSVGLIDDGTNSGWPELNVGPTNTSGPGCTGIPSGCGDWSEAWSESWPPTPHAGLGVLSFTPTSLTMLVVGNDGTERRSLVLAAP